VNNFCEQCGSRLQREARFCEECGHRVEPAFQKTEERVRPPFSGTYPYKRPVTKLLIMGGASIVLIVVVVIGLIWWRSSNKLLKMPKKDKYISTPSIPEAPNVSLKNINPFKNLNKFLGKRSWDILRDKEIKQTVKSLTGEHFVKLCENLYVSSPVTLIDKGGIMVSGNAKGGGGSDEAILCIEPAGYIYIGIITNTKRIDNGKFNSDLLYFTNNDSYKNRLQYNIKEYINRDTVIPFLKKKNINIIYMNKAAHEQTDITKMDRDRGVFVLTAIIEDPDGYTNVRSRRSASSDIVARVYEGERFYTYIQNRNWWQIKTRDGKVGYMHVSRIKIVAGR